MDSKNIVFTGKQQAEIRREALPALPPDSILVKTQLSLISSGTESICFRGEMEAGSHWANWVKYPFHPGYSNVGTIVEVGADADGYAVGDRVFSSAQHRQYHIIKPPFTIIPDEITDRSAAWSKLSTITQTGVRRAHMEMGDRVVVIGLGPLGQLITQYARIMGAADVLAIDRVPGRLAMAAEHGATQTYAGNVADALDFVLDHTNGRRADIVFDVTGHYAVLPLALNLARNFGTLMLIGDPSHPGKQVLTGDVLTRQIAIRGSHNEKLADGRIWDASKQIELFYNYVARGQMRVDDLITSVHPPSEAAAVYAQLLKDRSQAVGVAFDWQLQP
jgi:2-desacetyl-2-hydroxyethyl bacteriochlorophyllide A dehydrogenase